MSIVYRIVFFCIVTATALFNSSVFSQQVTFCNDIVPVLKANCSVCHYKKDISPVALEKYEDVAAKSRAIKYVVQKRIMPPWKADSIYHDFVNDRRLSNTDVEKIVAWIDAGLPKGDCNATLEVKGQNIDALSKPDMIVKMPRAHKIPGNNKDLFVTYVMKPKLSGDEYINAVVIKPGNSQLVHHARIEIDTSGVYDSYIGKGDYFSTMETENDTVFLPKPIGIYLPGLYYNKFPDNTGYPLKKGATILLHLHYAPSVLDATDQSEVHFYFTKDRPERKVIYKTGMMTDYSIELPPDSITTVTFSSAPLPSALSLFAVQLHMHLLGKSIGLIAVTPANDTIDILSIPNWDFNWQEYYYFKTPVIIPQGSILITTSVFDNTSNNAANPNMPPKTVNFYGMDTQNEMMGYIGLALEYKPGDEKIVLMPESYR